MSLPFNTQWVLTIMEASQIDANPGSLAQDQQEPNHEYQVQLSNLPKMEGWKVGHVYQYQGFWCFSRVVESVRQFQQHFQAQPTDVILATAPKSGTIWLKALIFSIINRSCYPPNLIFHHPLLTTPPHQLVPFLENMIYGVDHNSNYSHLHLQEYDDDQKPRAFATHVPYASLPHSIKHMDCKIVYLCRNPRDNFISLWKFMNKWATSTIKDQVGELSLQEAFELFCNGVTIFGPFWDHVLGYWKESLKNPQKVLFLKYEDLHKNAKSVLKSVAEFLSCGFSLEEEDQGLVEKIMEICSFEHLSSLEVNKNGKTVLDFERKILFRRGEVGDWRNYFTPAMVEQLDAIVEEKLGGSGLVFDYSID